MALRIYGGSHSTQGYNSIDNSFNIGGGSASYTAGELGANVGDRIIPYSPARWSCQILTSQPKVTAYLNRDNSITITKIEAVNVTFRNIDNGYAGMQCVSGNYYYDLRNQNNWAMVYNYRTSNGHVSPSYNTYVGGSVIWQGSRTLQPGENWDIGNYTKAYNGKGLERWAWFSIANTYSRPAPEPPSLSVSCSASTTTATVGSFSSSGGWGYCDNQNNSIRWELYADAAHTQRVRSGTGSSASFSGLAPNDDYYVNVIKSNGCFVVERTCSFTTLTPNTLSEAKATAWNAGCVRVAINNGGGKYKPTTTVKLRKCSGGAWKDVGTTTTTTVATVCFKDLEEQTCYQLQACTKTTAGTYCGNVVTFTTPKKCVQGVILKTDVELDKKTWATNAKVLVEWTAYAAPAEVYIEYRVRDGFDPTWLKSDILDIPGPVPAVSALTGQHTFLLPTLFPNLTEYEMRFVGRTTDGSCEVIGDLSTFITPLVPEPDPVKVCETMTYLSELICQAVKKLYHGNKTILANPTTAELCDPYSENPTHLTLWSRLLRFFHAMNCLLCNMADVGLKSGTDKQYYVGEIGWVDVLEEVLSDEDSESWRIVASNAIRAYIDAKLHEVWHYHKTVDYIVGNRDEMLALPSNAASCIVAAESKVYVKSGSAWVEALPKDQPDNFAVYHINNAYKSSFGDVKAESAYYYFQGTWNNLDVNVAGLAKVVSEMWDKRGEISNNEDGADRMYIQVNQANYDYSKLGCDKRRVCFVVEDVNQAPKGYFRVKFETGEQATLIQDQDVLDGATAQQPADPQRTGYTFNGWSKQGETTPYDWSAPVKENFTLVAVWDAIEYTITFNLNEGTGTIPAPVTAKYGETITLPDDTGFSRPGAQFLGWLRDGVPFTATSTVLGNTELLAYWAMDEFDVTVHPQNGQTDYTVHMVYNSAIGTLTNPAKNNSVFIGWFTSPDEGTGAEFDLNSPLFGPIDIYARYVPAEYTVTFDSAGGTAVPTQTVAYQAAVLEPDPAPTKDNVEFGWWMLNGKSYPFGVAVTQDLELVAKWLSYFTVEFINTEDETISPTQTILEGRMIDTIQVTVPPREGYVFDGWYNKITNQRFDISTEVVQEDMVLVAIYKQETA